MKHHMVHRTIHNVGLVSWSLLSILMAVEPPRLKPLFLIVKKKKWKKGKNKVCFPLDKSCSLLTRYSRLSNLTSITAHSCSRDRSNSSFEVLQVYIQTKQNQYTTASWTIGWAYPVYWEHWATNKRHRKWSFSIVDYSTEEQKSNIWTSTVRFTQRYKEIFWFWNTFWFLSITVQIVHV
jgi:hypothetical protein